MRTRTSPEFEAVRNTIKALGRTPESPLLTETRFREAWRNLCAVYAENSATHLGEPKTAGHHAVQYAVFAYVLARVLGFLILPVGGLKLDLPVAEDAAAIAAIEKFGPALLRSFRAMLKIPALQEQMEVSAGIRCSTVPLNVAETNKAR